MITHPTGSAQFADALVRLGVPAPWRLCDEEVGEVLADNGAIAFTVAPNLSDTAATDLALWILIAVNTLAGFQAAAAIREGTH